MFFFSSRRRHTRSKRDWSSDVCSSDLILLHYKNGALIERVFPHPPTADSPIHWQLIAHQRQRTCGFPHSTPVHVVSAHQISRGGAQRLLLAGQSARELGPTHRQRLRVGPASLA